jgi:hypothetical protein
MPVLTPPPRASAEAATARLVDGLQRRLQAEHPGGAVRRIETHISWLLLAGPHAYKLKKPLTLDFLDFGTPEQRRAACEEELRINRRSAPDLYLQVLPVTGTPDAPRLGGDARGAIDWAVHMRRFPDDALLSERAARGQLGPSPSTRWRARWPPSRPRPRWPRPTALGPPGRAGAAGAGQLRPLAALLAGTELAETLQHLKQWTQAEYGRLAL